MKKTMNLSRAEEHILLAVWSLKDDAYSVLIRKQVMETSRHYWSFGAVYMPLDRLIKKGLLDSYLSDPTPERGGRSKRIYRLNQKGLEALGEIREMYETMLKSIPKKIEQTKS